MTTKVIRKADLHDAVFAIKISHLFGNFNYKQPLATSVVVDYSFINE